MGRHLLPESKNRDGDGGLGQRFLDGRGPGLVPPDYASIILSISIIGSVWLKILL